MPSANSPAPTGSPSSKAQPGYKYPEQKHAGAVGLGPEYGRDATTGDKYEGLMEEAKGKILRKPELVQHGKDLRSGELKRRQKREDNINPFSGKSSTSGATNDQVPKSDDNQFTSQPPSVPDTSHPTEAGRMQQAATVAPEGSADAARQSSGEHAYHNIS